ncbi:UDP-N-acetylmuramoyl-L-alanyl-D-glutamate--2,6-diaminopimelate ligase [candidate division KSB1 bacterium]|nr:UDP-N-acetylmuramoyl-L-alanyl-D-glutamate--2,6-diaminopimelate ligase [candidate division KSB1 bacterium]
MPRLSELAREIEGCRAVGEDVAVTGITNDSRTVRTGDLFVAVPGLNVDAIRYVDEARSRGAVALMAQAPIAGLPTLVAGNVRRAMAEASWAVYGHPERALTLIGVTGTNGKTTVATVLRQVLATNGLNCGVIGTLGVEYGVFAAGSSRTTPEAPVIATHLAEMIRTGVSHVVMEATSIGIDLERTWKLPFRVTVFTNLTRDHLDYHRTEERYIDAKLRLFREQESGGSAVINLDSPLADRFLAAAAGHKVTYGIGPGARYRATNLELRAGQIEFELAEGSSTPRVTTPLVGGFNVSNVLAVIATAREVGLSLDPIVESLRGIHAARGRTEAVPSRAPFTVIIDYAHTPDALEKVLQTVRALKPHRVVSVFGAGGDRDRGKRPLLAATAARWCDQVWITSDNPRSEDPEAILDEIAAGFPTGYAYERTADRRAAIESALQQAVAGDVIVVAGKGHELYQEIAGKQYPFDDREVVRGWLQRTGYLA